MDQKNAEKVTRENWNASFQVSSLRINGRDEYKAAVLFAGISKEVGRLDGSSDNVGIPGLIGPL
ncbi:hypothetical protein GCM10023081_45840 [Arthrobacter ginkgonis]|uniref:Uncharacterized protein n=1 Tax=Arthrobacter ginkgonis TaxID=1630594 RepID=A0ABP7DE50_9MICC